MSGRAPGWLAIDTSIGTVVAVTDAHGAVVASVASDDPRGHAEAIGPLLADALHAAADARVELGAVVAGMGPGPFTGLRVGIAAARTFALGRRLGFHPVASHDAIAAAAVADGIVAAGVRFVVHTDARRREWAFTGYTAGTHADELVAGTEPALCPAGELPDPALTAVTTQRVPAEWLARLAAARLARGEATGADAALYLRAADVTLSSPKRVTG